MAYVFMNWYNPCFRGFFCQKSCIYFLEKMVSTRKFSSAFSRIYYANKYDEIRSRLDEIPCSYLLNKEADKFQHDLWCENDKRLKDLQKWGLKVFNCNTRNSSLALSSAFLKAYCIYGFSLTDTTWNQWDSDNWRLAAILAWFLEITASHMNILDDIVDQSNLRRGRLCWHREPDVGLSAIYDALALLWSSCKLLRKNFADLKCYMNIVEEMHQAHFEFAIGQVLDKISCIKKKSSFDNFTFERYTALAEHKGGQYASRVPVHLAMHLAGGYSAVEFEYTREICIKLALYYQSQNDRFDYVFPMEQAGVKGNDIRNGSLTWFAVKFLEEASESQRKQFLKNYGVDKEDAVEAIIELYKAGNILEKFQEFEEKLFIDLCALIESKDDYKGFFFYYALREMQSVAN